MTMHECLVTMRVDSVPAWQGELGKRSYIQDSLSCRLPAWPRMPEQMLCISKNQLDWVRHK